MFFLTRTHPSRHNKSLLVSPQPGASFLQTSVVYITGYGTLVPQPILYLASREPRAGDGYRMYVTTRYTRLTIAAKQYTIAHCSRAIQDTRELQWSQAKRSVRFGSIRDGLCVYTYVLCARTAASTIVLIWKEKSLYDADLLFFCSVAAALRRERGRRTDRQTDSRPV